MLHYINEISFHYISAGNAEAAQVSRKLFFKPSLPLHYFSPGMGTANETVCSKETPRVSTTDSFSQHVCARLQVFKAHKRLCLLSSISGRYMCCTYQTCGGATVTLCFWPANQIWVSTKYLIHICECGSVIVFYCRDLPGSASKVTIELETLKASRIASFIHGSKLG